MNKHLDLLEEIMRVSFGLVETNLYLDTHPVDEKAIMLHNTLSWQYKDLNEIYTREYGPLTYTGMSMCPWAYATTPWPWDIEYRKCKWD